MAKKKKNEIVVSFPGTNAEDVTGSCTHIEAGERQILLECGLYQSCGAIIDDYRVNTAPFGFKPKKINYIFVTHTHIDHIGRLPMLYAAGCEAIIIAPKGTFDIAKALLLNSADINRGNAARLSKDKGRAYDPLYTPEDVYACLEYWKEYETGVKFEIDDDLKFQFYPSGHILNSAQVILWVKNGNSVKSIGYTGDIGNTAVPKYFAGKFQPLEKCNLLIGESTYAGNTRVSHSKDKNKDLEKIKNIVTNVCIEKRGKVLIPVFANDRCQNMLSNLYDIFGEDENFNIPILIDSPLAIDLCKLYLQLLSGDDLEYFQKVVAWRNVKFVKDVSASLAYRNSDKPVIALACGGMMQAGRSTGWAASLIPDQRNYIMFCGYAPPDSIAGIIKEGVKPVIKIDRKSVKNRCKTVDLRSFSSHMQRDDMLDYYSSVHCDKIALVHGEFQSKVRFAEELQNKIRERNKTGKVVCVNSSTIIKL